MMKAFLALFNSLYQISFLFATEPLLEQWQQIRGHMYKTHAQFDQMLVLYHQTLVPHLKELGALESALTLPEKTMDLESLPLKRRQHRALRRMHFRYQASS